MVERVDINSVLMQMRQVKDTLRAQHAASQQGINSATNPVAGQGLTGSQATASISQFQQVLQQQSADSVSSVNNQSYDRVAAANSGQTLQPLSLEDDRVTSTIDPTSVTPDFKTMFGSAVNTVNEQQKSAAQLATRFEQGDPSIDLPEVMIALQKSSVSFQAMTQVRNKLVEAYKDIMNMPV